MSDRFPGAYYEQWDDAPSHCPREGCTGPLTRVSDGFHCVLCGRSFIVAQALAQIMNLERWSTQPDVLEQLKIERRAERKRDRKPVLMTGKLKKERRRL